MDGPHDDQSGGSQRAAAHAWAAGFRGRRSELRGALSDGTTSLSEVLDRADHTDDGGLKLLFVLESLPGAGKVSTRRRLAELGLDETTPLRRLTAEQRRVVLGAFPIGASAVSGAAGSAS